MFIYLLLFCGMCFFLFKTILFLFLYFNIVKGYVWLTRAQKPGACFLYQQIMGTLCALIKKFCDDKTRMFGRSQVTTQSEKKGWVISCWKYFATQSHQTAPAEIVACAMMLLEIVKAVHFLQYLFFQTDVIHAVQYIQGQVGCHSFLKWSHQ